MGDITCRKCAEPWDAYGARHGDMDYKEYQRFMRGEGCPSCQFGTICKSCSGTGLESSYRTRDCEHCGGLRYLIIRCLYHGQVWRYGYLPNTKVLGYAKGPHRGAKTLTLNGEDHRPLIRDLKIIRHYPIQESLDGDFLTLQVICPWCRDNSQVLKCSTCSGDGKFHAPPQDEDLERLDQYLYSMMDGTDEDPLQYIDERSL